MEGTVKQGPDFLKNVGDKIQIIKTCREAEAYMQFYLSPFSAKLYVNRCKYVFFLLYKDYMYVDTGRDVVILFVNLHIYIK